METIENVVTEEVAENVETTTEETEKTYTEKEVNELVKKKLDEVLPGKIARREAKIRKEYDRKYGDLEGVLRAGTGKESVEDITDSFKQYYEQRGVTMPKKQAYSDKDIEVLARADAEDIINSGYDEVAEEVERLTKIGVANMTPREKALFRALADHRRDADRGRELSEIGVTKETYDSPEFREFASKFTAATPIREIYDLYVKTQPKKEIRTMGSVKQAGAAGTKDYYSPEEIDRLTMKDLDDPKVWEAVRRSMTGK